MHIAIPYSLHASVIFPSWTLPPGCATYCDVDVNEENGNGNGMQIYMAFVRSLSKKSCYRYRSNDRTGKEDGRTQVGR